MSMLFAGSVIFSLIFDSITLMCSLSKMSIALNWILPNQISRPVEMWPAACAVVYSMCVFQFMRKYHKIYIYIYVIITGARFTSLPSIKSHYGDVIMSAMASEITNITFVYLIVYSGANQRKHQSSASLAFVRGIHRWPVNSPHKGQ